MNFLIKLRKGCDVSAIRKQYNFDGISEAEAVLYLEQGQNGKQVQEIITSERTIYIVGDLVYPETVGTKHDEITAFWSSYKPETIQSLRGFFYLIILESSNRKLEVYNSILSILPIYYSENEKELLISSRSALIRKNSDHAYTINKSFLLEKALFNYSLFNNSYNEQISLLASNSFIKITDKFSMIRHTRISDYFSEDVQPWKKSVDEISDLFISRTETMLPNEHFYHSLTGGLDGRTLLAISMKNKASFTTYSYGSRVTPDVTIPQHIANALNFKHEPIWIDEEYGVKEFDHAARELTRITEGTANISRAHYHYMAEALGNKTAFTFSGNFGSELLRPVKNDGGILGTDEFFRSFLNY